MFLQIFWLMIACSCTYFVPHHDQRSETALLKFRETMMIQKTDTTGTVSGDQADDASSLLCIVLAAGEGTRMRSSTPKVLHRIAGRSMIGHVLAAVEACGAVDVAAVIGPDRDDVGQAVITAAPQASVHVQADRRGTAHAVLAARDRLEGHIGPVIVLFGDTPLITADLISDIAHTLSDGTDVAVVGFEAEDPTGYGRLLVTDGALTAIREHKDASEAERKVTLCNSGVMGFGAGLLPDLIDEIGNDNIKGEYYLTDAVEIAFAQGLSCHAMVADEHLLMGVNDRAQLAEAEALMQNRLRAAAMSNGVTMAQPETIYLSYDSQLGPDTEMESHIWVGPQVSIGSGSIIRSFSHLEQCIIGNNSDIGPFARLRPGTELGAGVRIGNFVETKNAMIADGAKVNHLAYIGDATIGAAANIGAGTITCNYDGTSKHQTTIGAGAFVGSNSSLVAPISIGEDAYVGSGSVLTHDVPDKSLAVARGRQRNIEGWKKLKR
jgi:bifunctional UDP-N-acetylglucosamine pyrophosphorylase/glucosamine-1-phosphate N-acetyltransferase